MTNKERLIQALSDYFNITDTYAYNLTRVKEGFEVGTVTLDDFEEFDESVIEDLANYLIDCNVVALPCKKRDKLFDVIEFLGDTEHPLLIEDTVDTVEVRWVGLLDHLQFTVCGCDYADDDFGDTVFLSKQEAIERINKLNRKE